MEHGDCPGRFLFLGKNPRENSTSFPAIVFGAGDVEQKPVRVHVKSAAALVADAVQAEPGRRIPQQAGRLRKIDGFYTLVHAQKHILYHVLRFGFVLEQKHAAAINHRGVSLVQFRKRQLLREIFPVHTSETPEEVESVT